MALPVKNFSNCVAVRLPERIDMVLSTSIEKELLEILKNDKNSHVILNMEDVKVLTSSGLRVLITAKRKLKAENRDLVLCDIRDEGIYETFNVSRLFDVIKAYPTEDEAVKSLEGC